jgi:hypothetical protein
VLGRGTLIQNFQYFRGLSCRAGWQYTQTLPEMCAYQLRVAIVGVCRDADAPMKVITVPVGAVLTIASVTLESGLVDATWNGQAVSVFVQDLKSRGDLIRTTAT